MSIFSTLTYVVPQIVTLFLSLVKWDLNTQDDFVSRPKYRRIHKVMLLLLCQEQPTLRTTPQRLYYYSTGPLLLLIGSQTLVEGSVYFGRLVLGTVVLVTICVLPFIPIPETKLP